MPLIILINLIQLKNVLAGIMLNVLKCISTFSNKFFFSEEYDIEHLKNIFDSFTMGDTSIQPTLENPLKLSMVNNNIKIESQSI